MAVSLKVESSVSIFAPRHLMRTEPTAAASHFESTKKPLLYAWLATENRSLKTGLFDADAPEAFARTRSADAGTSQ